LGIVTCCNCRRSGVNGGKLTRSFVGWSVWAARAVGLYDRVCELRKGGGCDITIELKLLEGAVVYWGRIKLKWSLERRCECWVIKP